MISQRGLGHEKWRFFKKPKRIHTSCSLCCKGSFCGVNIGLCVPLTRSRLGLELPLPVVVGVAWGRSTSSFHEGAEKQSERVESGVGARCVHPVRACGVAVGSPKKRPHTSRREKQQRPQGKNRKCVNVLPHNHACPIKTQRPGTRHAQRTP